MTISDADARGMLDLARRAATEAGAMVIQTPVHTVRASTKSSPTDFVTEMDRAAERLILDTILAARPDDGMVGEEGASTASQSGISWLIDPIDGTTNYLRGIPNFSVSIAAAGSTRDGMPAAAAKGAAMGKPVAISAHKGGSDDAISKRAGHRGCLVRAHEELT